MFHLRVMHAPDSAVAVPLDGTMDVARWAAAGGEVEADLPLALVIT